MTVTVIIPTLARRPLELERAIASVNAQIKVKTVPLIVVNGSCWDSVCLQRLQARPDIHLVMNPIRGVSRARFLGRQLVDSPYFAFLDDDDELLPEAIAIRLEIMEKRNADVVATNGYFQEGNTRRLANDGFDVYPGQLRRALLTEHWLDPAGGLYRSATVTDEIFSALPDVLEWTMLADLLIRSHSIVRHNVPTYVRHFDAAEQVSRSWYYTQRVPEMLIRLESRISDPELTQIVRKKISNAYHQCASRALIEGDLSRAWRFHLKSLTTGKGHRFLSFTRHLLLRNKYLNKQTSGDKH